MEPLVKDDGWAPSATAAFEQDRPFGVAEIILDRDAAEAAWRELGAHTMEPRSGEPRDAGVYGALDDVDFDSHAVVVWSSGQSGSCPGWLAGIEAADDVVEIQTDEYSPDSGCTDDYNPYAMLVAVPRSRLPEVSLLPMEAIVDGRSHGLQSVIDMYPATGWFEGPRN